MSVPGPDDVAKGTKACDRSDSNACGLAPGRRRRRNAAAAAAALVALAGCAARPHEPLDAAVAAAAHAPPTARSSPLAAVYLTGDGGYAAMDRRLVASLAAEGVSTVALDSAVLFKRKRTPEEAAQAVEAAIRASRLDGDRRVLLIGFSFGADLAPFAANRLGPESRRRLAAVVLVNPTGTAAFQVTWLERLGLTDPGARPVAPEAAATERAGVRVVCLHGERDACPSGSRAVALKGDHTFGGDGAAVARAILAAAG